MIMAMTWVLEICLDTGMIYPFSRQLFLKPMLSRSNFWAGIITIPPICRNEHFALDSLEGQRRMQDKD